MPYDDIRADELREFLQRVCPLILDMRDTAAFNSGHIEGAVPADEAQIRRLMKHKQQPVLICCYHGHSSRDLATFLCQMGMTDVYNLEGGWHALSLHMARQPQPASSALTEWLEKHGFRGHSVHGRIDRTMTTLMVAALDGKADIVAELLDLGADLHAENSDGNQALWFAAVANHIPILEMLLKAGADIDHLNENGYTCLMYAASTGKLDVIEKLLNGGANATICSPEGLNAMECATTLPVLKRLKQNCLSH
ncbi:ankyrin repeat domain-containing protein [Mariprofundus ferrooxydans]|uniref:ankyrin repeat domain-containing protein n=1 Tax=Mariprofundus ferrooxydans TaxID=314344 RepID=UPI00037D5A32|nr:ankyrin repeat domain-containing protein [Mariprofundus ferrooxydans]